MTFDQPHTRHDSFTLTRVYSAAPADVFALFEETAKWRRWFRMPGREATYDHEFRVGSGDTATSVFVHTDGRTERLENRSDYLHIEPDRRIVYAYASAVDDVTRWVSLVTVELQVAQSGTELTWTEQVAFVTATGDGSHDLPHLRGAIQLRLNALGIALAEAGPNPGSPAG